MGKRSQCASVRISIQEDRLIKLEGERRFKSNRERGVADKLAKERNRLESDCAAYAAEFAAAKYSGATLTGALVADDLYDMTLHGIPIDVKQTIHKSDTINLIVDKPKIAAFSNSPIKKTLVLVLAVCDWESGFVKNAMVSLRGFMPFVEWLDMTGEWRSPYGRERDGRAVKQRHLMPISELPSWCRANGILNQTSPIFVRSSIPEQGGLAL